MPNMTDAYSDFRDEPSANLTSVLRSLADEYEAAQAVVKALEAELEIANAHMKDIAEFRIPEATDGMEGKFNLGDGRELQIKQDIRSSIAGEKRVPAIKWLDDNFYGHLVKRQFIFEFAKGEEQQSQIFISAIEKLNLKAVMKENFTVHHATLNSWVKEQLGEGVDLPRDTFGIFRQRSAKVKTL
jgi:hypothetical protein